MPNTASFRMAYRATTVTSDDGKYHPAVQGLLSPYWVQYWPSVIFIGEDDAFTYAAQRIDEAERALMAVTRTWDILPL